MGKQTISGAVRIAKKVTVEVLKFTFLTLKYASETALTALEQPPQKK